MPGSGMTQIPDVPAETGLYPIIDVDGEQPRALTDFIGAVTIGVAVAGTSHRLGGVGDLTDRGVQFHQQHTADVTDIDEEVWAITEDGGGVFWAEPLVARVNPQRR
jgi:hypothetical protein